VAVQVGRVKAKAKRKAEAAKAKAAAEGQEAVPAADGAAVADDGGAESTDEAVDEDPVKMLETDLDKWRELALRTSADLDNYRKRMARDREEAVKYANQSLLEELLPVLDNFEMGMTAAATEKGSMIYVGMEMVQRQFADWLAGQGVTQVEVKADDEFDPTLHEAMSQEASDEVEAGRILRVMRTGFRMRDRLVRPATVVVSSGPAAEAE